MKHLKTCSVIAPIAISLLVVFGLCSDEANSCRRFNSKGEVVEVCVGDTPSGCTMEFVTNEKVVCDGKKLAIKIEDSTDKTPKPSNP